jgi:hypothetical protein
MGKHIPQQERARRILKCFEEMRGGALTKKTERTCGIPIGGLYKLSQHGFVKRSGSKRRAVWEIPNPSKVDETDLVLMGELLWGEDVLRPAKIPKKIEVYQGEVPKFIPQSFLEEFSKDLGKWASLLGHQFGAKCPPGMAQHISRLEMDNQELRTNIKELEKTLAEANRKLASIGKQLRRQADAFDSKFSGEEEVPKT